MEKVNVRTYLQYGTMKVIDRSVARAPMILGEIDGEEDKGLQKEVKSKEIQSLGEQMGNTEIFQSRS